MAWGAAARTALRGWRSGRALGRWVTLAASAWLRFFVCPALSVPRVALEADFLALASVTRSGFGCAFRDPVPHFLSGGKGGARCGLQGRAACRPGAGSSE